MLAEEALHKVEIGLTIGYGFHTVNPSDTCHTVCLDAVAVVAVSHYLACSDTTINIHLPEDCRTVHPGGCADII